MNTYSVEQSRIIHFFTASTMSAPLWLLVRLYLGYEWFIAGWEKVINPVWFGPSAGAAVQGFVKGALTKTTGLHPDVSMWYASFLQNMVLPNATAWSNAVAVGEVLVGLGLIVGLFTGIAAFFGFVMNMSYLLAGTVSMNPVMLFLALLLMAAWRVAGYWGLDRFAQPMIRRKFFRLT
ncbi:MAG: DoxX family membrane protein [Patescibacteria group bacterium]